MQSFAAMQQSCTRGQGNCFFPVNKGEEEKEQEDEKITTTMQSTVAMQHFCTHGEGNCFFPVNEEKEKEEEDHGRGG